jgi:hypothetical protein
MENLKRVSEQHRRYPPGDICRSFPCKHSSFCTDQDYLADQADSDNNREVYKSIWALYHTCETQDVSVLRIPEISAEIDRCQRIMGKWKQIQEEIRANKAIFQVDELETSRKKTTNANGDERIF